MQFENAKEGIKKIFTYELFQIIIGVMSVIIAIMGLLSLAGAKAVADDEQIEDAVAVFAGFGIGTLVLGIGGIVLTIIGYVLLIKGTNLASRDEPT